MHIGIIKPIARNHLSRIVVERIAMPIAVVGDPFRRTSKLILYPDKSKIGEVGHTHILRIEESRQTICCLCHHHRAIHPIESVHDQDRLLGSLPLRTVSTQHLRGETNATLIPSRHLIPIDHATFDGQRQLLSLHQTTVIKVARPFRRIEHIGFRHSGRLQRIGHRLPSQTHLVLPLESDREGLRGQRLHHRLLPVLRGDMSQHTFINSATHHKAEFRIQPITHIREVLMGKQLQQHRRHFRHSRLYIRLVPHPSATPFRMECRLYIRHDLRLDAIGQIACHPTALSIGVTTVIRLRIINTQCTHDGIIRCDARIRMESKAQINRDMGRLSQPVHPARARENIISIVIRKRRGRINRIWHTRPLQPIASRLREARESTGFRL